MLLDSALYLPNGQTVTVVPLVRGVRLKSYWKSTHSRTIPIEWDVTVHLRHERQSSAGDTSDHGDSPPEYSSSQEIDSPPPVKPTLHNDILYISSASVSKDHEITVAIPSISQMAMVLWISFYWYFQQCQPSPYLENEESKKMPIAARPKGMWKVRVAKDGLLRHQEVVRELECMGLLVSEYTSQASEAMRQGPDDHWDGKCMLQSIFWQLPARLFISTGDSLNATSHSPAYKFPLPLQFTVTEGVRHPLRPASPPMGTTIYTRFIPSVGEYLSFRVASTSPEPVPHGGPAGPKAMHSANTAVGTLSDTDLLKKWFSNPRITEYWGDWTPNFLQEAHGRRHSFPVIGLWDGRPFGYYEIYWVKEDILGRTAGAGECENWDRGLHNIVGEAWARGRVSHWLMALLHYCFTDDNRTMNICLDPRVDNERFISHLQQNGFNKHRQISYPSKQAWYVKLRRDAWEGPTV